MVVFFLDASICIRRTIKLATVHVYLFVVIMFKFNRFSAIDPAPSRLFALRVLELKEHGISEDEAMEVADVCNLN